MNNTKERPLILTAQEVNAVLAGDKTQHRVILSSQPYTNDHGWQVLEIGSVRISDQCVTTSPLDEAIKKRLPTTNAAPYRIGDRLWVQEPSLIHCDWDWFYADNTLVECKEPFTPNDLHLPWDDKHQEYTGSIAAEHLPRWASRLLLEITDIRIERVQNTSHDDAVAEGVHNFDIEARLRDQPLSVAQIVFSRHWDTKHQEHCVMWEDNPWVWVIEFKVIKEASNG